MAARSFQKGSHPRLMGWAQPRAPFILYVTGAPGSATDTSDTASDTTCRVGPLGVSSVHATGTNREGSLAMDAQSSAVSFGRLLRQYRRAAGLTQETLAEQAGYSAIYLRKL